jgi:hypothetical protein
MVSFGAVLVDDALDKTFYGKTRPISAEWDPKALAISGHSREEHEGFDDPAVVMESFANWVNSVNRNGRPIFTSDNVAYDWQWINYYLHQYLDKNVFGYSGRRIGDIICGLERDLRFDWKKFRKTKHDHNPANDAIGNAEALMYFVRKHQLKL